MGEETAEPNLGQIEGIVMKLRQELSEKMVEGVASNQEAVRPVPGPGCQGCGKEMRYCHHCERGLFPPGQAA